jgi:PAS domain S-box-containing protein
MSDEKVKVLLVEDNPSDAKLIQYELKALEGSRFEVTWVDSVGKALSILISMPFDVCLLDLSLPDSSGMATFTSVRHTAPGLPVVVLTGLEDDKAGLDAIRQGVQDFLTKGLDNGRAVVRAIRYAIERQRTEEALQRANADLERRVAVQTAQIRQANEQLERRIAERTGELAAVNSALHDSRRAALNLAEDAIEARREAEKVNEDLFRSREEWVETFNVIPDHIAILDQDHVILRSNKSMAEDLGLSVHEMMGQPCFKCVHDSETPHDSCPHALLLKDGKQHIAEIHDRRLEKDFLVSVTPFFDKSGNPKGAVHVARDITLTKKRENELIKLNRTLSALGKSSQAMMRATSENEVMEKVCGIVVKDCGYKLVWIGFAENDAGRSVRPAAYAGFDPGYLETLDLTWADTERGRGPTGTAIRTGEPCVCRNMATDPGFAPWREDAIRRGYASSIVFPLMDAGKAFGAISIYSEDIDPFTDDEQKLLAELADDLARAITSFRLKKNQKLTDDALHEERNFVRTILQTTGGLIVGFDLSGRIKIFNQTCEKITGYTEKEVHDRVFWDFLIAPEEVEQIKAVFSGIVDGSIPAESENENYWIAKDGSRHFIRWANTCLLDDDAGIEMIIGTGIDITERKTLEELINRKVFELTAANKELDAFAYSVSHDLRNPLHVITGFANLLLKEYKAVLGDRGIDFVKTLLSEINRMSQLITDMLYLGRITRQEMQRKETNLSDTIERLIGELRAASPLRRVETVVQSGVRCMADERLIYIMLQNLIGNAWKFTKNKEIARIEFGETVEMDRRAYFIRDNGDGFSMEQANRLFNPFQRLHTQEQFEGTGIGLAIVKRVVSRHGGEVWTQAEKGRGATFYFTLD